MYGLEYMSLISSNENITWLNNHKFPGYTPVGKEPVSFSNKSYWQELLRKVLAKCFHRK